jgi:hypothetical protein
MFFGWGKGLWLNIAEAILRSIVFQGWDELFLHLLYYICIVQFPGTDVMVF